MKNKILNNHEFLIEKFLIEQEKNMKPNQRILDAGAGQCQYRGIFNKRHRYVSQDLGVGDKNWDFSHIDIRSPIDAIPEKSKSFDYIILTQVLEHVNNPEKVMKELARLLKPYGKILLTAPLCAGEHQMPHHYYNYTREGIKYLSSNAGLKVVTIKPMGGYFTYLGQILQFAGYELFGETLLTKIIFYPWRLFVTSGGLILDRFDRVKNTTSGYIAIIEKV